VSGKQRHYYDECAFDLSRCSNCNPVHSFPLF
jgi:hypothetical protein